MVKKITPVVISLVVSLVLFGCGSSHSAPKEIDVVGMTVGEARSELIDAGWSPDLVDETPYSDFVPGEYENGNKRCADKVVTHVEFFPSKSAGKGYATKPSCKIYFESHEQSRLEEAYDLDHYAHLVEYDWVVDRISNEGVTEDAVSYIEYLYQGIRDYDPEKIPESRAGAHQQLVEKFQALLDSVR